MAQYNLGKAELGYIKASNELILAFSELNKDKEEPKYDPITGDLIKENKIRFYQRIQIAEDLLFNIDYSTTQTVTRFFSASGYGW